MDDEIESGSRIKIIAIVVAIVAGIIAILIVISFSYLDYYELGLKRQKSTGTVDKSKIYEGGRHFIGPDFEFKIFPADLHYVNIVNAKSFTSDRLEVGISAYLQYVIRKDELVQLHDAYDLDYNSTIEARALDALKGAVTIYNVRELINERSSIEKSIFKTVRERLGGTCCNYLCGKDKQMCSNCIEKSLCTPEDKGLNVEVKYFQLTDIEIPNDVGAIFIRSLLQKERAEEEMLKQDAVVVRKETTKQVQVIRNAAKEISEEAEAQAKLIATKSQANYTATLEGARSTGLRFVFESLNLTEQAHKNSFDYLRTIRGLDSIHLTVDYQQRIAGNL